MKCPYLKHMELPTCRAGNKMYIPTLFEFDDYCTTREHKKCPFYKGFTSIYPDQIHADVYTDDVKPLIKV